MALDFIYRISKPFLLNIDAETSHSVAISALRWLGPSISNRLHIDEVRLCGLNFKNRLGLAAGFDKDGAALIGLSRLGFGFLEIGTVTPRPQPGNPRPRLIRVKKEQGVINRLGFNNHGVEHLREVLLEEKIQILIPIGVNIGKNAMTPNSQAAEDYKHCMDHLVDIADFVTINISSPNTQELRDLADPHQIRDFLAELVEHRNHLSMHYRELPLFVKIAPDGTDDEIAQVSEIIERTGCNGIIATNTTVRRDNIDEKYAPEAGGLSGKPLFERAVKVVATVRDAVSESFPIIGVGGISSPDEALTMLNAGANLIQLYTAMIYQGPGIVEKIGSRLASEDF